jgi:hypothetical protein
MTETNPIATDTVIIRAPDGEEIKWRTRRMVSLGADAALAATIAESYADVHEIERLLKAGCPLDLAWTIARPSSEPQAALDTEVEGAPGDDEIRADR